MFTLNIKIQDFQRMENFEKTFDKSGAVRIKQEYENREPSKFTNSIARWRHPPARGGMGLYLTLMLVFRGPRSAVKERK